GEADREKGTRKRRRFGGRYKDVRIRKWGHCLAEVRQPKSRNRIWLGSYQTPEEAARAYDAAVFCLRGPSALLNFQANPPEITSAAELSPAEIHEAASRHAHKIPTTEDVGTAPPWRRRRWLRRSYLFGGDSYIIEGSNGGFRCLCMGDDKVLHDHGSLSYTSAHFHSPHVCGHSRGFFFFFFLNMYMYLYKIK
ncbi:AP2/ERF domain containing protein, partial [Parasponia andersonii]